LKYESSECPDKQIRKRQGRSGLRFKCMDVERGVLRSWKELQGVFHLADLPDLKTFKLQRKRLSGVIKSRRVRRNNENPSKFIAISDSISLECNQKTILSILQFFKLNQMKSLIQKPWRSHLLEVNLYNKVLSF